jgi:hypothetical protein
MRNTRLNHFNPGFCQTFLISAELSATSAVLPRNDTQYRYEHHMNTRRHVRSAIRSGPEQSFRSFQH